jgi:outer membrane lipoprotein-sorting protein
MNMQGMSMKSEGTIEYLIQDGKELFRMDMTMKQSMGGQEMDGSMSTIADGQFVYAVTEMMGQKMAMKQKPDSFQGAVGGKQMFEDMKKSNELKLLPDEKVDGQATFVIEATPKSAGPRPYANSKMFFAKDSGIMVKMVGVDTGGNEVMTMKVSDVKRDPKIDADRFVFKAPEGVQVMDMTGR